VKENCTIADIRCCRYFGRPLKITKSDTRPRPTTDNCAAFTEALPSDLDSLAAMGGMAFSYPCVSFVWIFDASLMKYDGVHENDPAALG
jgi:hypothetical protein